MTTCHGNGLTVFNTDSFKCINKRLGSDAASRHRHRNILIYLACYFVLAVGPQPFGVSPSESNSRSSIRLMHSIFTSSSALRLGTQLSTFYFEKLVRMTVKIRMISRKSLSCMTHVFFRKQLISASVGVQDLAKTDPQKYTTSR